MKRKIIINFLKDFKSDLILLLAAIIWGFAFVAQRKAMENIGPFLFNAIRFFLGATSLLPLFFINKEKKINKKINKVNNFYKLFLLGIVLFIAGSLQQIGIVYTDAGKAGFITGLYIVFVPLFGLIIGRKTTIVNFIAAIISSVGLFLLSINITNRFFISYGDLLVLIGAFFWAIHVLYIDFLSKKFNPIFISIVQFYVCSILSFIFAFLFEKIEIASIKYAVIPILYGGILSVGVAYTLQVIGQKKAHPSHAAIILSMESVFALLGGIIILNEFLLKREFLGIILMFSGMIISQLSKKQNKIKNEEKEE
jgi:drug/metabolite transporter (DMT)-like permease